MAFWTLAKTVGKQVLAGILGYEGANAWARWTGATGDALNEHADFLREIRRIVSASNQNRDMKVTAIVEYEVAQRELALYRTDRQQRIGSLAEARVHASAAMSRYAQFKLPDMASCWQLAAQLYLSILQEEHKLCDEATEAEAAVIRTHRDYMLTTWGSYVAHFIGRYRYELIPPGDVRNNSEFPKYQKVVDLTPPRPGTIDIVRPIPGEREWYKAIEEGDQSILPLKGASLVSPEI